MSGLAASFGPNGATLTGAEARRERQLLLRGDVLLAEEEHQMPVQGGEDLVATRVIERLGQRHAFDLGAQRRRHGTDRQSFAGHLTPLVRGWPTRTLGPRARI